MADVFISYSSKDREEAQKVAAKLKTKEINCWIDIEDIPKGEPYDDCIPKAISQCSVIVMLIGDNSMASKNVKNELRLAIYYKKPVIPFMLEDIELRDAFLYHIEANNRIFAYQNWYSAIANLVDNVAKYIPAKDTTVEEVGTVAEEESSNYPINYILKNAVNEYSQNSRQEMCNIAERDITADYVFFQEHLQKSNNNTDSQLILGNRYLSGQGLKKDANKAVYWLGKAISHQNAHALYLLGDCFANGTGVTKNLACAACCYELSASQSIPYRDAIFKVAECYANNRGVSYDPIKRAYWFRKASEIELTNIRQARNFAAVNYTFNYIELFKQSPPDIVEKLRVNGYSMDALSEEQIEIVEQIHKEHIEELNRARKKREEENEQIRRKLKEQYKFIVKTQNAGFAQYEKETKRTKTIEHMLFVGCGVLVILAIYSFVFGMTGKPLMFVPHGAIALAMILIGAILVTPKLAKPKQKKHKVITILRAILIGIFVVIAIAVCAWLIYQLGKWMVSLFLFLYICAALGIFVIMIASGGRRR